ncbi:MAG: DnaT-like ssDNA-binding domain-containing protein [Pontibacterium sp.]
MLIYPSLAEHYGLEGALLLGIYHQLARHIGLRNAQGFPELKLDKANWSHLVPFWDQDKLASVTHHLVSLGAIEAAMNSTGIRVLLLASVDAPAADPQPVRVEAPVPPAQDRQPEPVSRLAVMNQPPSQSDAPPLGVAQKPVASVRPRTPAPGFGGSTGWRKHKSELQVLFEQHEERNQNLHAMFLKWQPSAAFFEMLPRHGISEEFARDCVDEFVLYWLDKDRRETSWDQKFLGWVKRDWVKKQSRDGRDQRQISQKQTGFNHEDPRRDSRENRKRVTRAIMDIKDTDW